MFKKPYFLWKKIPTFFLKKIQVFSSFSELPISSSFKQRLNSLNFSHMNEIQEIVHNFFILVNPHNTKLSKKPPYLI